MNSLTFGNSDDLVVKDYQTMFDGNLGTVGGEITLELCSNYEAEIEPLEEFPLL